MRSSCNWHAADATGTAVGEGGISGTAVGEAGARGSVGSAMGAHRRQDSSERQPRGQTVRPQ